MSDNEREDKPDGKSKQQKDRADYVRYWLDTLALSSKDEEEWRKDGEAAVGVYRGDKEADETFPRSREFNIFHANVETVIPAIYNSTPVPDVRRRFGDKDKVAKVISQILERSIAFSLDNYDFDETMRQAIFDGQVPGRGLARVRYVPYFSEPAEQGGQTEAIDHEKDETQINQEQPDPGEVLTYEEVCVEYVPWKRLRIGPADEWAQVPWIAFEHFLTRKEIEKLCGGDKELAKAVQLDCRVDGEPDDGSDNQKESDNMKRGRVWEIWDKSERKVIFIATGNAQQPLREEDDPLGLEGFYPTPRPIQPILTPGNLVPVCPYTVYRTLVEELNEVTFRIKRLVRQIRVKAGYAGGAADLMALANADDGQLIPLEGVEAMIGSNGDLSKAIAWWPIEPIVKALAQLYQQREQIKQAIYEVTGLSDIVRGASKASETATAQEIKQQWGSLRIQKMQAEVQRFARDIFRLMAEIIATKFSPQTVMMISGVQLLPKEQKTMFAQMQQQAQATAQQAQQTGQPAPPPPQIPEEAMRAMEEPAMEDVFNVMRSDMMRAYRVDVESDSTIRADLTRNQRAMSEFLAGTAQYIAATGPAVQAGQLPPQAAVEIFTAFARNFKLGKQAEDALDKMSEAAQKPQPPKPDPEAEKMKAQIGLEEKKMQLQQQGDQAKLQLEAQKMQMQAQNDQAKAQSDMALAQQKMQFDMELEREKAGQQYQIEMMKANADIEIKRQQAADQAELNRQMSQNKMYIAGNEAETKAEIARKQARAQ